MWHNHSIFYPRDQRQSRRKLGLPIEKKIILHLGSEIPRKNVPLVLRSLAQLKKSYPELILLRHGEETLESSKLIRDLNLDKEVIYINYSSEEDLPFVYSAADILVQPSSEEGFCFPVIEAMACGLPVVASNRASLPEICGGAEAKVLKELSEDHLARKIEELLSMSLLEIEMIRKKGIENSHRFDWQETARQVLEVYQKVLSR